MQPRRIPPLGPPKSSAREKILAQFRGVDVVPLEKAAKKSERAVQDDLKNVLGTLRMDRRQAEAEIVRVWNHLIDPVVASHAQPVGLAKGTLFVKVDSHVWLEEIVRYRRKEILNRVQHSFGPEMIKKISFSVG